jgi:hypothetical protein
MRSFSDQGTMIDLEHGDIISQTFSVIGGIAHFGGEIKVRHAEIGGLWIDYWLDGTSVIRHVDSDLVAHSPIVRFGNAGAWLVHGNCMFVINDEGVALGASGGNIAATSDGVEIGGAVKARPYSVDTEALSEVVTKQDLINLGLIKE